MFATLLKNKSIKKLRYELERAKKLGHIFSLTDITDVKLPGGQIDVIGIEIMFSSDISEKQVCKVVKYIQDRYKFCVLTYLLERGIDPKILIVEY